MILKVHSKEYAVQRAWPEGISWGESQVDHCIYVGDVDSLQKAGVLVGRAEEGEESKELQWRRYQIILPEYFNDASSVPEELMQKTIDELVAEFEGITMERGCLRGVWKGREGRQDEMNLRITCDVYDTVEDADFFRGFKEVCKNRFAQEEIWLTSFLIDKI